MDTLRLSDADRETAIDLLGEQYAVGRLTKDEFDERSDAVWSARTRGDLVPVFADLPVRASGQALVLRSRVSRRPMRRGPGWPIPLVPVLFVLVALMVLTSVPFLLLALGLWFVFARCGPSGGRRFR